MVNKKNSKNNINNRNQKDITNKVFNGKIIKPIHHKEVLREVKKLVNDGVDAISVCFMHSYKNSKHESNQTEQSDDDLLENEDQEDGMVDQLNEELESLKDKLLRTMAEMENVRKQSERQRSDLIKYGNQSLARDLIGVLDNLERASNVEAKQENLKALKEGIDLTSKELDNVLENGVNLKTNEVLLNLVKSKI